MYALLCPTRASSRIDYKHIPFQDICWAVCAPVLIVCQVMALLAYLYEFKQNYGPHLIIVPNAVMVNWKAELQTWLPDLRCIYYTGTKDERAVKFQQVHTVQKAQHAAVSLCWSWQQCWGLSFRHLSAGWTAASEGSS